MQLTMSEIIERPIEDVFRYVTDVERIPEWIGVAVSREKLTDGPMGPGTRIRAVDKFMGRLHHRMPVILEPESWEAWLADDPESGDPPSLTQSAADGVLASYPVSPAVGDPRNNGPELIEAYEAG